MGENAQRKAGVPLLKATVVNGLASIPRYLLEQKEDWDVDRAIAADRNADTAVVLVSMKEGGLVGFFMIVYNSVYNSVAFDTMVVDHKLRSMKMIRGMMLLASIVADAVKEARGASRIIVATDRPRAIKRILRHREARATETVLVF